MKVSREQADQNRERVLEMAGRLFRERGIEGVSVAEIMKAAGLTHGGFYGQFESKEDLIAQACARTIAAKTHDWIGRVEGDHEHPLEALIDTYLTRKHRDSADNGCPFSALGGELARSSPAIRDAVTGETKQFINSLARALPGANGRPRRKTAIAAFSTLLGSLLLARLVNDRALSDEIMKAGSEQLREHALHG